jgi:hypothetical protein
VPEVAVVHLVWEPVGPAALRRFADSYRAHPAGAEHRLVIVFKGFGAAGPGTDHRAALAGIEHETLRYDEPTLDLPTYAWCADALDAAHLCFLNSESVLLGDGWLAALLEHLSAPGVGAVGATGSFERPRSINPLKRRRWPSFPNPHLRTNAFALPRALMRELRWPAVRTKAAAWELESGRDGFTRQVWGRGLRTLVVGRDGRGYPPEAWPHSATFRSGGQANLLVADNRTRQWEEADPAERARLSRMAWGDAGAQAAGGPMRASGA